MANDSLYGLADFIQTGDPERAMRVARNYEQDISQLMAVQQITKCHLVVLNNQAMAEKMVRLVCMTFLETKGITLV